MGTDIHGVFQRRTRTGKWEDIESNYDQNRHYQLFAVLAGVRNGFGFAGVKTGEAVRPIADPRGFPADFVVDDDIHPISSIKHMDPVQQTYHQSGDKLEVWMGDHSHSWLTGAEMLKWFMDAPTVVKTGILPRKTYERWNGSSAPDTYCGGISGGGVIVVNDNAQDRADRPAWTHIRCTWDSNLRSELAYFFDEVARLAELHGDIRFVFGFDS